MHYKTKFQPTYIMSQSLQGKGLLDILGDNDLTTPINNQTNKTEPVSSGGELLDLLGGLDLSAPVSTVPALASMPAMQPIAPMNSVPNLMDGMDALQPMGSINNQNTDLLGGLTNNIGELKVVDPILGPI